MDWIRWLAASRFLKRKIDEYFPSQPSYPLSWAAIAALRSAGSNLTIKESAPGREGLNESSCPAPGPAGKPLVGNVFEFRRDPTGFLTTVAQTYGDIVHFKFGSQDVYLLNHPDYIETSW